jgi:hypothetical protein
MSLVNRGFSRGTTGLVAGDVEDPYISAGKHRLISTLKSTGILPVFWA